MEGPKEPAVLLSSRDAAPAKERYQYKLFRTLLIYDYSRSLLKARPIRTTRSKPSLKSTLCCELHHKRHCHINGARTRGPSRSPLETTLSSMPPRTYLHFLCIFVGRNQHCSGSMQSASTKMTFKNEVRR